LGKLKENAMDQDKTIPSELMPHDYQQPHQKSTSKNHPIWKIILGGLALVIIFWMIKH